MPREHFGPDNPREWLARARSALLYAQRAPAGVDAEDVAFQAQQAAEKAVKAVLIRHRIAFPFTHNLTALLSLVQQAGREIPATVMPAADLTLYAVGTRYPNVAPPVAEAELRETLAIAEAVVRWAEEEVGA